MPPIAITTELDIPDKKASIVSAGVATNLFDAKTGRLVASASTPSDTDLATYSVLLLQAEHFIRSVMMLFNPEINRPTTYRVLRSQTADYCSIEVYINNQMFAGVACNLKQKTVTRQPRGEMVLSWGEYVAAINELRAWITAVFPMV